MSVVRRIFPFLVPILSAIYCFMVGGWGALWHLSKYTLIGLAIGIGLKLIFNRFFKGKEKTPQKKKKGKKNKDPLLAKEPEETPQQKTSKSKNKSKNKEKAANVESNKSKKQKKNK